MNIAEDLKRLQHLYDRGELTKAEYSAAKDAALKGQLKRPVFNPRYRTWKRAVRMLTVHAYKCPQCGHEVSYSDAKQSYKWDGKKPLCPNCGVPANVWKTKSAGEGPR